MFARIPAPSHRCARALLRSREIPSPGNDDRRCDLEHFQSPLQLFEGHTACRTAAPVSLGLISSPDHQTVHVSIILRQQYTRPHLNAPMERWARGRRSRHLFSLLLCPRYRCRQHLRHGREGGCVWRDPRRCRSEQVRPKAGLWRRPLAHGPLPWPWPAPCVVSGGRNIDG